MNKKIIKKKKGKKKIPKKFFVTFCHSMLYIVESLSKFNW